MDTVMDRKKVQAQALAKAKDDASSVDSTSSTCPGSNGKMLIDSLMEAEIASDQGPGEEKRNFLTRDEVSAQIKTFLLAGTETTSSLLASTVSACCC